MQAKPFLKLCVLLLISITLLSACATRKQESKVSHNKLIYTAFDCEKDQYKAGKKVKKGDCDSSKWKQYKGN